MELRIAERDCRDEQGIRHTFHYYLTVDTEESPRFCMENYGVRIDEEHGASTTVPAITTSADRIDRLMTLLVDNLVGPTGLRDVLEDWL